ncbi:putative enoyl-CoA hydratase [Bacillus paralicheniformis]|uniref:enoyl-CoA hydratase n=1 Tax=Bacillus paralicheniformis TaxID=1648923 RepID=UPI000F6FCB80|nr:enoyl-CoA hydratase [Bacillus paralicheniformis]MEC2098346.1 enoyl-CoA hydratase [Bacillus paralicheniformis]MEC2114897.1 enoyl-CoA hydratase [Bacillus paralicheniformis]MEC2318718.1 enoyl-CoA hydratase [Bacillus paralicheniformis]TWN44663.1 putative enoyl-CoA hydratase [Bacillus paralicheniformis]TWN78771.1 putative enoyl-CoA hydratase [Bacillus paralicheniformis]
MAALTYAVDDYIATITIQHPPANALSTQVLEDLSACLEELSERQDVRSVVIHGEGRFFSAGADIKEFTSLMDGSDYANLADKGQQIFEKVESFPKPVIAAIHGAALGGGLELAMACHIRIAEESAKLGLPELNLGIIPGFAGTQRLPKYVGTAKALEMIGTSEPISGKEAFEYGLVTILAANEEEVMQKAQELARKFAEKSPQTMAYVIELLNSSKVYSYEGGLKLEGKYFGEVFQSEDAKEGIQAFLEKRKPHFKGK